MRRRLAVPLGIALVFALLASALFARRDRVEAMGEDERPAEIWRYAVPFFSHAVAADNGVYVGTTEVDASRVSHGILVALDAATGVERWRFAPGLADVHPPSVDDETIYLAVDDDAEETASTGVVVALDAANGAERWRFDSGTDGVAAPTFADGAVYVGNLALTALDAATGVPRWRVAPDEVLSFGVPLVAGGIVYASAYRGSDNEDIFLALDAATGEELWRYDPGPDDILLDSGRPVRAGDVVLAIKLHVTNPVIFALDATIGVERWRLDLDELNLDSAVAAADGTILAGGRAPETGDTGALLAIDPATGEVGWRFEPEAEFIDTPVVVGGTAYTASLVDFEFRGRVYAIDTATGDERWSFAWEGNGMTVQAAVEGMVYVADYQGTDGDALVAFEDQPSVED